MTKQLLIYEKAVPVTTKSHGDWSIKGGHFYTLLGYEVVTAPDNFFYSHAFTMYLSEAFTHTGALVTYEGLPDTTVYAGWTAGWDTGFDQFFDRFGQQDIVGGGEQFTRFLVDDIVRENLLFEVLDRHDNGLGRRFFHLPYVTGGDALAFLDDQLAA